MNYKNQFASSQKKERIPAWIKSTLLWKFLSTIKLIIKRMSISAPYWKRSRLIQTFRYFMMVEVAATHRNLVNKFEYKDIKFNLRPMEWHLMEAILLEKEYGRISRLFEKHPPKIIVDAGANVGMFSVYVFSVWKKVTVYAVEPGPDTFEILDQNKNKNLDLDWHTYQYAFWDSDGAVIFEDSNLSMGAHVSSIKRGIQVPSIRLDHFMEKYLPENERVSILKMDIEGAEEVVLKAAQSSLHRVDMMIIEIHSNSCDEAFVRDVLGNEFPFVYELPAASSEFPVLLASREVISDLELS